MIATDMCQQLTSSFCVPSAGHGTIHRVPNVSLDGLRISLNVSAPRLHVIMTQSRGVTDYRMLYYHDIVDSASYCTFR